jgi:enoyl-CoA hydratase/carnithine racemase/3-hydroxyacyl-CoA dehydrogenase
MSLEARDRIVKKNIVNLFTGYYFILDESSEMFILSLTNLFSKNSFITLDASKELEHILNLIEKMSNKSGLIIRSKNIYCNDGDVYELKNMLARNILFVRRHICKLQILFNRIEDLAIPTVTIVDGNAERVACKFSLLTDFRIVESNAQVMFPEVRIGLLPNLGGITRLSKICDINSTIKFLTKGTRINTNDLLDSGFANVIYNELEIYPLDLASSIIKNSQQKFQELRRNRSKRNRDSDLIFVQSALKANEYFSPIGNQYYHAPGFILRTLEETIKLDRYHAQKVELSTTISCFENGFFDSIRNVLKLKKCFRDKGLIQCKPIKLTQENKCFNDRNRNGEVEEVKESTIKSVQYNNLLSMDWFLAGAFSLRILDYYIALENKYRFRPCHDFNGKSIAKDTNDKLLSERAYLVNAERRLPIIINEVYSSLILRFLAVYSYAFEQLILDGADFVVVDKVMTKFFGWKKGPAELQDAFGLDLINDICRKYVTKSSYTGKHIILTLNENLLRIGCKGKASFKGFYSYQKSDEQFTSNKEAYDIIVNLRGESVAFHGDDIINRLMLPLIFEVLKCSKEREGKNHSDIDIALIFGLGFPIFRGGIFQFIERLGPEMLCQLIDKYYQVGEIYQIPKKLVYDICKVCT